jgi:D-alanyl-D-alanine-carboxypeptidase/D-alanyl-D-alanine-endopeptidase
MPLRTSLVACAAALLVTPAFSQFETRVDFPKPVAEHIRARVDAGQDAGIIAMLKTPEGTATYVYGISKEGEPLREDHLFEIGSISKTFTSLVLAQMALNGDLSLDDPINKFFPEGTNLPERNGKQITLRQLSMHRSGLPSFPPDYQLRADPNDPFAGYHEADLMTSLSTVQLARDPGEAYEYSNLGVGLLGFILAKQNGMTWEQMVKSRIVEPLGLKDMTVTLTPEQQARFAQGHSGPMLAGPWGFDALAGCGALRGTAADMLRYTCANAGIIETPLYPAMQGMMAFKLPTNAPNPEVALAWHITTGPSGASIVWHNGGTGGYRTFTGYIPDTGRAVVVFSNTANEVDRIGVSLLVPQIPLPDVESANGVKVAVEKLKRLEGKFALAPGAIIDVREVGGQLTAELTGQQRFPVYPTSDTEFFYKVVEARIVFGLGEDGNATFLTLYQNGRELPAMRVE